MRWPASFSKLVNKRTPSPDFSSEGVVIQQVALLFLTAAARAATFLAFGIGILRRGLCRRRSDHRYQAKNQKKVFHRILLFEFSYHPRPRDHSPAEPSLDSGECCARRRNWRTLRARDQSRITYRNSTDQMRLGAKTIRVVKIKQQANSGCRAGRAAP